MGKVVACSDADGEERKWPQHGQGGTFLPRDRKRTFFYFFIVANPALEIVEHFL
jgi:hypothetical protein